MVLGYILSNILLITFAEFLPQPIPPSNLLPIIDGFSIAWLLLVTCAFPAILALGKIPVVRVLKNKNIAISSSSIWLYIVGSIGIWTFLFWRINNFIFVKAVLLSIIGLLGIIILLVIVLGYIINKFKQYLHIYVRF